MSADDAIVNKSTPGKKRSRAGSRSLAAIAYEEVRRRIIEGTMPQGYPILESELAASLGVSRTPLREALARLRNEDLLVSIRRKGIFVRSLSLDDMREIGEILEALEGMTAKLAAERATAEELQGLEDAVCGMEQALERDDIEAWNTADEAFHAWLLAAAHNRRIQEAVTRVQRQWRQRQQLTLRLRQKPTLSTVQHRATLEAIKARDGNRARDIDQRHSSEVNKGLIDVLKSIGSQAVGL